MDMNNTGGLHGFELSLRAGWKDEEKLLLWDQVKMAQRLGAPLKQVFETVAQRTGRKPNSVRNYYYMKVKETGEIEQKPVSFVSFAKEEIYMLMKELLSASAKGESIRGASLRLAGGDKTLMLRYQNKYRSLIKSARALVEKVMEDMDRDGLRYISPYAKENKASYIKEKSFITQSLTDVLMTCDVDVKNFFGGLNRIATMAATQKQTEEQLRHTALLNEDMKRQNDMLTTKVGELMDRLKRETEKSSAAANLFRQLLNMGQAKDIESFSGLADWLKESAIGNVDAL